MRGDPFDGLSVFLAVAERRSFTRAAADLGVSTAAVSQAVRALEARLAAPLFQRTSRRVGLTEAGAALLARIRPAAQEIAEAFDGLAAFRDRPAGMLRLTVPRIAVPLVLAPVLPVFRRIHAAVTVEVAVEDEPVDIAARGFDAGIRIGEAIERDMVAVRLTPEIRWIVVAAPTYLAARGRPATPEDLTAHDTIRYRYPGSAALYRWEFVRDGRDLAVDPPGGLIVNDGALANMMAAAGLGLSYTADLWAAPDIAAGRLATVLDDFAPTSPGLFLYFPARAQSQPKLRAFIDTATSLLRGARI
jgi:DNA-binding transcriptional LysR family regulator